MRGEELYKILDKHINQLEKNGLSIIDAATGYGKSYQARKYILDNIFNRKFIFLVPQKKLFLDLENIKNELIGIKITPTLDTFKEFFCSIKYDDIFEKINNYTMIERIVNKMNSSNEDQQLYLEVFNKEEYKFRCQLKSILRTLKIFKRKKGEEGLDSYNKEEILSFFDKHKWIKDLYPAVLLPYANIVQMTIQKAYFPIDTLWYGHHEISNKYDQLFKDYIIFIDEFDTTKEMLQSLIISSITGKERVNLFKSIKYIYNSITNVYNNNELPSMFYGQKKEDIVKDIKEFSLELKYIYEKFNLNGVLKFLHNEDKDRFLFRDKKVIDITRNKGLVLEYNSAENVNYVELKSKKNNIFLEDVCESIFEQLEKFTLLISKISKNYYEFVKENKKGEGYSLYEVVSSVISELNIGEKTEEYFIKRVYQYLTFNTKVTKSSTGDFLDFGFQYFCMENEPTHDMSTNVYYYHFDELPEHFILGISRSNIVVGLSATATLSTYVKNYDMNYLSKKLGDKFIQINQEEIDLLIKNFNQNEESEINIDFINDQTNLHTISLFRERIELLDSGFNNINWNNVLVPVLINGEKAYRLQTYYNILEVFKKYCENKIHGFICFLNFGINHADELIYENFKNELIKFSIEKEHKCNVFVLDSNNFDCEYEKIKNKLKEENVFIISTYQTLSLGKNLQYLTSSNIEKDLDGLYLDKISYILPTVELKNTESLAEYLYAIEYLKSELIINNYANFQRYITEGFKKYLTGKGTLSIEVDSQNAKDAIIAKYMIQSIGRICRTQNKADKTFIYMHQSNKQALMRKKEELLHRMLNYEFKSILNKLPDVECDKEIPDYIIDNNYNNSKSHYRITYLSYNWWTDLKRQDWISLREQVLKKPTKNDEDLYDQYYCRFNQPINEYKYQSVRLSENKLKIFNISDTQMNSNYSNIVSDKASRITKMLKSKYVYDYFIKKGYAVAFEKGTYVLNPATFQRVYKGAIGEVAARAILEAKGITLTEITDNKYFEKFDYYNGFIYYDMKNWNQDFKQIKQKLLNKVAKKAIKCGAKKIFIINVLKNDYEDVHNSNVNDEIIHEIPWLYDSENDCYNEDAIKMIKKAELEYGDFNK